jgi:hypothetical protein
MNTNANINNTIATTTTANNLLTDVTTWKETALNLSRILSDQTDIVNLLNKKLMELASKNKELSKENAELRFKVEIPTKSNTAENKIKDDDVVTKIVFYDYYQFCYETLYIEGEVKLQDLPNDMQKEFGYHCTTHSGECELVLQDCIVEFGNTLGRIEIDILNKDEYDTISFNKELCDVKTIY